MVVLLASDRSIRSDGGLMAQKYHRPARLKGAKIRRAPTAMLVRENRACRRNWAAYSSIIAG